MQVAPYPSNESVRLAKLKELGILDTLPQQAFDDITALASSICETPIALISLVDIDRQWFKSKVGLAASQTPRNVAFCAHAILEPDRVMVVNDTLLDARFADNPLVEDDPRIRFYAGAPIVSPEGLALGTVCAIDREPRVLSQAQQAALRSLSSLVSNLLEHQRLTREEAKRHTEEALRYNSMIKALVNNGLDLKSFVDTNYTYQFVNEAYLSYWGKEESEVVGKSVVDLVGVDVFESIIRPPIDRALAGEKVGYEVAIAFPAKGLRHVEVSYIPARDHLGEVMGVVVRVNDIQQRKERELELEEAVELLRHKTLEQSRFIHIVSHDLREPINTINNFASLLVEDTTLNLPNSAQRYLDFVAAGGQRMHTLLEDLIGFLNLERHSIAKKRLDLTQIASQVRDDLTATLLASQGRIEFGHLPMVYGDPSLLRIALQNLVANGLKFVEKSTKPIVNITALLKEDTVQISVTDNGIGMEGQHLDKIFDMFQRLHSKKEYPGTGLGLSICRRVAELHGGELSVNSKPDMGSTFVLTLPMLPPDPHTRNGDEHL